MKIAGDLGYEGQKNAVVLYKMYTRYIVEGYEKSSTALSGVAFPRQMALKEPRSRTPQARGGASSRSGTPNSVGSSAGDVPRQKRVYRKRQKKDIPIGNMTSQTVTPMRLNTANCTMRPIKYNILKNKTFKGCSRGGSPVGSASHLNKTPRNLWEKLPRPILSGKRSFTLNYQIYQ